MKKPKEKHRYVFPNIMSKMMKNVPMNVQLESSMMASSLILVGMTLMTILLMFFSDQTLAFKIITLINMVGAFIFISSSLVTTYQQYVSYMNVIDLQKSMALEGSVNGMPDLAINDLKMNHKINRKNQLLFFGGLIFAIVPMFLGGWFDSLFPEVSYAKYLIMVACAIVGVAMIYFALKKKKNKVIKNIPVQAPVQQIQQPAPVQQIQQPGPEPRPRLIMKPITQYTPRQEPQRRAPEPRIKTRVVREDATPTYAPAPTPVQAPAPVVRPTGRPIPAPLQQRPVAITEPVQRQPQRPVERPQMQQRAQPAPIQQAPIRRPMPALIKKFRQPKPSKKDSMLRALDESMEERLWEIERLKAQQ